MLFKPRRLLELVIFILISLLSFTGCGKAPAGTTTSTDKSAAPGDKQSSAASDTPSNNSSNEHLVKVTLYFPAPDADGLVGIDRTVNIPDGAVIKAMLNELQNPPSGLDKPLPEGTKLLSAEVKDGIATLNLSGEFRKNFKGGSAGEQMILFSIVDTLTTLPNVQSVQFLLEGQKQDAILGQIDTTKPLKRNATLIRKS
ncbi:MAG: GerMN domain-containing protein [Desulfitobacteriaceae bacterium]